MSDDVPEVRIGDAERDDAIALLQEHLTAGRLDHAEFDERISRALAARTQPELTELFADLPGRRPGATPVPAAPAPADVPEPERHHDRPWFAQWWMILVAVAVAGLTRGRLGPIVPLMAIWLWIVYPAVLGNRRRSALPPPADPTPAQRAEIDALVRRGEKVRAIKAYREATGADLAYATAAIDRWQRELG